MWKRISKDSRTLAALVLRGGDCGSRSSKRGDNTDNYRYLYEIEWNQRLDAHWTIAKTIRYNDKWALGVREKMTKARVPWEGVL